MVFKIWEPPKGPLMGKIMVIDIVHLNRLLKIKNFTVNEKKNISRIPGDGLSIEGQN